MNRFWNWLKGIFNRGMDKLEDPEVMLDQARRDMESALSSNREKAVQAISQRNRLQMMLDETLKKGTQLENQATMALKSGNRDLALQFMREKTNNDTVLTQLQDSLTQASATVDQVKVAIKHQEEEVRKKTAEALAMKAQWKNAQIQNSISKALDGLSFENQFESSFGAAAERIKQVQSEAAARQEMQGSSLQGKAWELQSSASDMAAEEELKKLEARLSTTAPAVASQEPLVQTVSNGVAPTVEGSAPAAKSEAELQLEELEKRMKGD